MYRHGEHACPGRFFAANEIKVLMVYTLMSYDIKFPPSTPIPQVTWYSGKAMLDMTTHLLWKHREKPEIPWKDVFEFPSDTRM